MTQPVLIGFDLDGTLEDSRADMVAAVARVRNALGLPARPAEAIVPHVNKGMAHLYRCCFEEVVGDAQPGDPPFDDVKGRYEADYGAHIADQTQLYAGMSEALAELGERAILAVITNKPEQLSRKLLDALGIAGHFATVVGGDSCALPKPSPLMFEKAAGDVSFDRTLGQAFHVGDTAGDMKLARAAGITGVWAQWGYLDRPGAERPDRVASTPALLPSVIFPLG